MGASASVPKGNGVRKLTTVTDYESTINGTCRNSDGSFLIEMSKIEVINRQVEVSTGDAAVVALPRGGILVNHSKGTIQFGLPPETIKDALLWGLSVPTTFVILGDEMFDRQLGINIAEFEFPAYFNYFVFGKRVTLITTESVEKRVRAIFRETLLGPQPGSYDLNQDFSAGLPGGSLSKQNQETHWPDFVEEGLALDSQREFISVDALLNFEVLDKRHELTMTKQRQQRKHRNGAIRPSDAGKIVLDAELNTYVKWNPIQKKYVVREGKRTIAQVDHKFLKPRIKQERRVKHEPFDVPVFGVTMLGTSHGFDPKGTTTGFVVWVNRRGIMVDPPPDSSDVLRDMAISSRLIDGMILTHCHADHDAGAFQKILADSSIKIYTTQTIMDSFIRKYAAISNLDANFLRGLFVFERVKIGERLMIHGGEWDFFYSLHVIPTIGFEVKFAGEGIVYSGDTCTNPKLFDKMRREKRIGKGRYDDLCKRSPVSRAHGPRKLPDGTLVPAYRPHILHEAGVPPIHTPLELLAKLPTETRERLFVVHVDQQLVAEGKFAKKLKTIPQWSTLRIDVDTGHPSVAEKENCLPAIIGTVHFFKYLKDRQSIDDLLAIGRVNFYSKGTVLATPGQIWETTYLVRAGVALERTDAHSECVCSGTPVDANGRCQSCECIKRREDTPRGGASVLQDDRAPATASERHGSPSSASAGASGTASGAASEQSVHVRPTFYYVGDIFGSQSLIVNEGNEGGIGGEEDKVGIDSHGNSVGVDRARTVHHEVVAYTDLYTIDFPREAMLEFLRSSEIGRSTLSNISAVARSHNLETWNILRLNNTLNKIMNRVQQQELQKILSLPRHFARYEVIFNRGDKQECMYLVASGSVNLFYKPQISDSYRNEPHADESEDVDLGPGTLVGDVNCLKANTIAQFTLTAKTECTVYEVERINLMNFLNRYPGIKLQCIDKHWID